MSTLFQATHPAIGHRVVHLDLKGTPPVFSRLLELLELFAALRFTAVLIEWEDAFPWSVDSSFRSATAYSDEEVGQLMGRAEALGLEIIPLVQTLGHMENFLKGEDKIPLREIADANDAINPLAPGAAELVQSLVLDILRLHPRIKRFHLGGDEAWAFGSHPDTNTYIRQHGAAALYLHHMEPLLELLNERGIRPMLWHDMMVKWDDAALARLAPQCDLVVWGYGGHPDHIEHHYHSSHSARFAQIGFTLWGGTAFKGADGHSSDRPNPLERRINAQAWLEVASRYHFTGLITTGWSRYSFNSPQCESIEASLDTLLEQALLMHEGHGGEEIITKAGELLAEIWTPADAERFVQLRKAATDYSDVSLNLWYAIRTIETQLNTCRLDPLKQLARINISQSKQALKSFDAFTQTFRELLAPLIPKHWLDQYFSERNEAIKNLLMPYLQLPTVSSSEEKEEL